MMTGIPIENSIWSAYLLTAFLVIVGFAFYDIFHRRVPDRALVFFIPLAAAAPLIKAWSPWTADNLRFGSGRYSQSP